MRREQVFQGPRSRCGISRLIKPETLQVMQMAAIRATALAVGDYEVKAQGTGFCAVLQSESNRRTRSLDDARSFIDYGRVNAQEQSLIVRPLWMRHRLRLPRRLIQSVLKNCRLIAATIWNHFTRTRSRAVEPTNHAGSNPTSGAPLADSGFTFGGLGLAAIQ